ncbi:MAG: AAA family ATPase [Cyanobacteriota bacterium]|jgi:5-methylcytosine-specific restriction protein B
MESGGACWFVGAFYGGTGDQTPRFLEEGIWENGYEDKYLDAVKSIQAGDRIAIKSCYTQKRDLPFDNRGQTVSVMAIKAIGAVTANLGDGRTLKVEWQVVDPPREWYFYTYRGTVWRVLPGDLETDALIAFTFENKAQDINWFRNAPYWRERFGDRPSDQRRFQWTRFYEAIADKLLHFRNRREELIAGIHAIADKVNCMSILNDQYQEGVPGGLLTDICPFTTIGIFNRGITDANRKIIARELAALLGVSEPVPDTFEGIPTLNNQRTWFFAYSYRRQPDDIDILWEVFAQAIAFSDSDDAETRSAFASAYDQATECWGVGWNLTIGLYWIRPWNFPTLDKQSQGYISKTLNIKIGANGVKDRCSAGDYLKLLETLEARFQENGYPVHSFPELSLVAWRNNPEILEIQTPNNWKYNVYLKIKTLCSEKNSSDFTRQEFQNRFLDQLKEEFPQNKSTQFSADRQMQLLRDSGELEFLSPGRYRWLGFSFLSDDDLPDEDPDDDLEDEDEDEISVPAVPIDPYSIDNILADGCFISREKLTKMLERLRTKKNLILQGPPGTGKTWLAKRLAFALMGQRDNSKVRAVQFHPNLSYEDFIRGWRPAGDGKLALVDGPFMEMISAAIREPTSKYVIVIEEINRGNPAQIFGEMLTLLEVDKRTPNEALELSYRRSEDERVFMPDNLYVIGTMNIADRSLALVDLALRRRFAFIDLEPALGKPWQDWVRGQCGIDLAILLEIEERLTALNNQISADANLGDQFRVGHSYVTPPFGVPIVDAREWFRQAVETEIGPLLDEYWFDSLSKARKARESLLEGF